MDKLAAVVMDGIENQLLWLMWYLLDYISLLSFDSVF